MIKLWNWLKKDSGVPTYNWEIALDMLILTVFAVLIGSKLFG